MTISSPQPGTTTDQLDLIKDVNQAISYKKEDEEDESNVDNNSADDIVNKHDYFFN